MSAQRPKVVVGVCGGVAAYKGLELVRLLVEAGFEVQAVPTISALRFVGEASFAALSGQQVKTDLWAEVENVPHVSLAQSAAAIVVAPTTADFLAKVAGGFASDLLSAIVLTAKCPVVLAPAMHTEMWENPATVANVATLRARGVIVLEPSVGRLTGADSGVGRLPDPVSLAVAVSCAIDSKLSLVGKTVLITAGGTREPLDPVRFLGNRSTGKQGYALAAVAAAAGAKVDLVSANVSLPAPAGVKLHEVGTAQEMQSKVQELASSADAIVMAAAVADYRPLLRETGKIKKASGALTQIELVENPDILQGLSSAKRSGQVVVGFAAETESHPQRLIELGRAKLQTKGCDLLVVNEVGEKVGFGAAVNSAQVINPDGSVTEIPTVTKEQFAISVWHLVSQAWRQG